MEHYKKSLLIYLKDISKIDRIDRCEEIRLAERIKEGDKDDEAFELFVNANLRLVVSVAREYGRYSLPIEDVIEEGNMGLMVAVRKFDPENGAKFSTYAVPWIKNYILRALKEKSRNISVPIAALNDYSTFKKTKDNLELELEREPTIEELENELVAKGISKRFIKRALANAGSFMETVSLDCLISNENDRDYGSFIEDKNAVDPRIELERRDLRENGIPCYLSILSDKQRYVVERRYGLDGHEKMTLDKISQDLGLTRERVRQIEEESLKKLRVHFSKRKVPL